MYCSFRSMLNFRIVVLRASQNLLVINRKHRLNLCKSPKLLAILEKISPEDIWRYAILNGIGTNKTGIKARKTDGFKCPSIFASTVWLVNSLVTSYHRIVWYVKFLCSEVFDRETPVIMVGPESVRLWPACVSFRPLSPWQVVNSFVLKISWNRAWEAPSFKRGFLPALGGKYVPVPSKVRYLQ